jgi:hypothetical protein
MLHQVPGHPIIGEVLRLIRDYFEAGRHLKGTKSIIKSTGPGIWSDAIANYLYRLCPFSITIVLERLAFSTVDADKHVFIWCETGRRETYGVRLGLNESHSEDNTGPLPPLISA